jgi:hypothetical protein
LANGTEAPPSESSGTVVNKGVWSPSEATGASSCNGGGGGMGSGGMVAVGNLSGGTVPDGMVAGGAPSEPGGEEGAEDECRHGVCQRR